MQSNSAIGLNPEGRYSKVADLPHLEEDVAAGSDGKVVGVEEAMLHGELGARQPLPIAVVLHHIDRHVSVPHGLQQAAHRIHFICRCMLSLLTTSWSKRFQIFCKCTGLRPTEDVFARVQQME